MVPRCYTDALTFHLYKSEYKRVFFKKMVHEFDIPTIFRLVVLQLVLAVGRVPIQLERR